MLQISKDLKAVYPGGLIGAIFLKNAEVSEVEGMSLKKMKESFEDRLRYKYRDFNRSDLTLLELIKAILSTTNGLKKPIMCFFSWNPLFLKISLYRL